MVGFTPDRFHNIWSDRCTARAHNTLVSSSLRSVVEGRFSPFRRSFFLKPLLRDRSLVAASGLSTYRSRLASVQRSAISSMDLRWLRAAGTKSVEAYGRQMGYAVTLPIWR
jgi:hypothetical protein